VTIYGKDFAEAYNESWGFWGEKMWPFLSQAVARRVPRASRWLDLCCGTGSLLKILGENGFEAVGVDLSPHQLRFARRNAPGATLVRADVRSFDLPGSFHVVTALFDSLNYLLTKRDLLAVFRRTRRHLAPGGLFVFDMNTLEGLHQFWRQTIILRGEHRTLINETSFDDKTSRGLCRITGFVKQGRLYHRFQEDHVQRGYTAAELDDLLRRAGFRFCRYDGHTFTRRTRNAARLLYTARPR